jgi:carbon starvation protein CstA
MFSFFIGIGILILGYVFYGAFVEKLFKIQPQRPTPANSHHDGVDYVSMSKPRNALIQLLNIAGVGPIFGPILGALYGPVAFIWIALGAVFAGAVHDFLIGMISLRNKGAHLPELVGRYLGHPFRHVVNGFCLLLLVLVATVFVTAPARLIFELLNEQLALAIITVAIFCYYLIATILPVHRIIGPIYPWIGGFLLLSSFAVIIMLFVKGMSIPEFSWREVSSHPQNISIFPLLFLTISCGAISGFHATQTPIIARTLENESHARPVFYGMMILEGIIAMIWCAAALALKEAGALDAILIGIDATGPAGVVKHVSLLLLGSTFGFIAVLGVIVLPITSGDTAFRSARMIVGDYLRIPQIHASRRIAIAIPLFVISIFLTFMDFSLLWRYFSWANQSLAAIALWTATIYLARHQINIWIALLPALLLTAAANTYLLYAPIGFGLPMTTARIIGITSSLLIGLIVLRFTKTQKK